MVVVAHKAVSKAEGRVRWLADVEPSARAQRSPPELDKDARHVQVVLDESSEVLRATRGVTDLRDAPRLRVRERRRRRLQRARRGLGRHAAARSRRLARGIRRALRATLGVSPAVLITDSFGRAWRHGQCDVAIGCAGLEPLEDWRGRADYIGRELSATWIAIADQLASAADLARTKDGRQPVVLISGAERHVTADDGPGARVLLRPENEDLFR